MCNTADRYQWSRRIAAGCVAVAALTLAVAERRGQMTATVVALPVARMETDAGLHAILVADRNECLSLLEFAHVFERRTRLHVTLEAAPDLHDRHRLMETLGLESASGLVVYDSTRVVRMVLALPVTVRRADQLARWAAGRGQP